MSTRNLGKVLFATTVPGTLRRFLLPLADRLRSEGTVVDALTGPLGELEAELRERFDAIYSVSWSRSPVEPTNVLALLKLRLSGLLSRYDLVHCHTPIAASVVRAAVIGSRRRPVIIYTAHGLHFHGNGSRIRNALFKGIERGLAPWTDFLVVMNREDELSARRFELAKRESIHIPGVGLDCEYFSPASVDVNARIGARKTAGIPEQARILVSVGEFNPGKRHRDLLRALAAGSTGFHLVLCGAGRLEFALRQEASSLGLTDRVHFLGYVADIRPILSVADAFVFASEREGLPRSLMEAAAMQVPIIAADARGSLDVVEQCGGITFPVGSVERLAAILDEVWRNPFCLRAAAASSRARAMERYELSLIVNQYIALFRRALEAVGGSLSAGDP